MADQFCFPKNYFPEYGDGDSGCRYWPVTYQPSERLDAGRNPAHPDHTFSPLHGVMEVWRPSKRRTTLDRFSHRIEESNVPGSDLAIAYLREKYNRNMAAATISQSGGVLHSFLLFLHESGSDFHQLTSKDIGRFVERDQDNGLKSGAIRTKLQSLYAFISFLVEQEVLSYELLHKRIRIKREEPLPKAIPAQDIKSLLAVITNIRDRAIILLLLRTGMRIGELLNVTLPDLHLSEQKILIYQGEKNYLGRVVYFSKDAKQALRKWLNIRDHTKPYLFYSKNRSNISYVATWTMMRNAIKAAGLSGKGYSLHSLRHTFATDMLNAGLRLEVLQQLLGHQSVEITRRYARMSDTTRENEYFKAMVTIENGGVYESHRVNSELQAVFEEKKLVRSHNQKLST
jgi:integrase/recombinase XerD